MCLLGSAKISLVPRLPYLYRLVTMDTAELRALAPPQPPALLECTSSGCNGRLGPVMLCSGKTNPLNVARYYQLVSIIFFIARMYQQLLSVFLVQNQQ